jgi:hypothetical protein
MVAVSFRVDFTQRREGHKGAKHLLLGVFFIVAPLREICCGTRSGFRYRGIGEAEA